MNDFLSKVYYLCAVQRYQNKINTTVNAITATVSVVLFLFFFRCNHNKVAQVF